MSPQDPTQPDPTPPTPPAAPPATATPTAPATQTAPATPAVQNALTLVMPIKSPEDYQVLFQQLTHFQGLPPDQNPLTLALASTHLVHFARFIFLEDNTKLGVITSYDGTLADYLNAFIDHVGQVFDLLLAHMADAPPLPVEQHRQEFLQYVTAHDLPIVQPFYSAYPSLTVLDILANAGGGG
jgi:hypothetical protein